MTKHHSESKQEFKQEVGQNSCQNKHNKKKREDPTARIRDARNDDSADAKCLLTRSVSHLFIFAILFFRSLARQAFDE